MNDDVIKSLWDRGKKQEPRMSPQDINNILEKSVRSGWPRLRLNVQIFSGMMVVASAFSLLNLADNLSNPLWLAVHAVLTVTASASLIFSMRVLRELRALDEANESLTVLVRRQLQFFHTTFELWLWVAAVTTWLLSFSVVVWIEDLHGHYRIVAEIEFLAVSAAMVFGSYALLRLGHYPMIQRTLAALHDLEAQISEQTERVQAWRKYWTIAAVALVVLLTIAVVWTIAVWRGATP